MHKTRLEAFSGGVLWANLHLLFWLSLLPFVTGWMGENHFSALPSALYVLVAQVWLVPDRRIERILA